MVHITVLPASCQAPRRSLEIPTNADFWYRASDRRVESSTKADLNSSARTGDTLIIALLPDSSA
jgi:hypothetical protein